MSNVRDYAQNNQHMRSMSLLRKRYAESAGLDVVSTTPIGRCFNNLSDEERDKLRVKFDIAYFVECKNFPFTKYSKICDLEAHHGVYQRKRRKEMIHYIAETRRHQLTKNIAEASFFSLLLDG